MILVYIILVLVLVLLANTFIKSAKAHKLQPAERAYDEQLSAKYAEGLGALIRCKTVSVKDSFDDTEFKKLRDTVSHSFPKLSENAELMIFGESCLVYKLKGKDESRNIMLMSHHDVVEAKGEWQHEPFGGEVHDGKVWGRGAADTKGSLYAELQAVEELLEEGFVPACNLYIASSHNEEIGGNGIPLAKEYFEKEGIRFELIMDEGGAIIDPPLAGMNCEKCAMIAVHEKGRYYLKCTVPAATGHTGLNAAEPAVQHMAKFISDVSTKGIFIRRIHPQLRGMFEYLAPYCGFAMKLLFSNLWLFGGIIVKVLPKLNATAGTMLGTTCTFSKINCDGNSSDCTATALLRNVDAEDFKKDLEAFKKLAEKHGVNVEFDEGCEDYVPADMSLPQFEYAVDCVREIFPAYVPAPYILPAGTDARTLTSLCDCTLRFAPLVFSKQQFNAVHNNDENLDVKAVYDAVLYYKQLVRNYK